MSLSGSISRFTLAAALAAGGASATTVRELPPGARAGECFAHSTVPAVYRTEHQSVAQPPLISWKDIPATYRTATRQELVTPGRVDHETIPAVIGTRVHWVEHPGPDRTVSAPPEYRWIERRVVVRPAHLEWRRGEAGQSYASGYGYGESVRVQPTGEVMCRVRVPAEYEIRRVRVLVTPGRTCVVKGPTTRERVVEHFEVHPARVIDHPVAPVYRTVTDRVLVTPARHVRIERRLPPRTVDRQVLVTPAHTGWSRINCAPPKPRPAPPPRPRPAVEYGSPAPAQAAPSYGQPYTPDYAPQRPRELDGAPVHRSYHAPDPTHD